MADRTVSVRLRADVTAFIAAMRAAERAVNRFGDEAERNANRARVSFEQQRGGADRLERELRRLMETQRQQSEESRQQSEETRRNSDETRRSTEENDRNTQSQNRNRRSTEQATRGLTAQRGTLVSLITLAGSAGAAAVSAAVAFGAFATVAAPAVYRVVSAQEDLAENWSKLSAEERVSAIQVRALTQEYRALAKSYEPQALGAFNSMISTARGLLPQIATLVGGTSGSIQTFINRINEFVSDRVGGEFLAWAGREAPRALDVLGGTLVTAGDTALDLLQDIEPLGIGLLQLTHGTLSAINAVANLNPMLAQFAVSALLLRAPLLGVANMVGGTRDRMRAFSAANAGASRSAKILHGVMAAGPALYVAAGAALVLFAIHVANAKTETDKLIEGLKIQHRATGNNLQGYQSLRNELQTRYVNAVRAADEAQRKSVKTAQSSKEGTDGARQSAERMRDAQKRLKEEIEATDAKIQTINRAANILGIRYGVTADQARRMADAAGVDLSTALDGTGKITNQAAAKLDRYRAAVELANQPMKQMAFALQDAGNKALTLTDRLKALQAAFEAQFTPSIAAYQATTQLKEGFRTLAEQMSKAKGSMDGSSAASLQLRNAFAQQLTTLQQLHTSTFQLTGDTNRANAAVNQYLPVLYALAGGNREARAQVDALARVTGFNINQTNISKQAFITQASAMLGSKASAEALWRAYVRLTGATTSGTTAVTGYIDRVRAAANEERTKAARTHGAATAQGVFNTKIRDALPVLYALAGNNRAARAQVDALARSTGHAAGVTNTSREAFLRAAAAMKIGRDRAEALWRELNKIKNRDAHVSVTAQGSWHAKQQQQWAGRYHGGPIYASVPGATRARDSVPAMLRVDEHVWTPEEVDAVGGHAAMYRLRAMARAGQLQGYARGGKVSLSNDRRSTPRVVGDVVEPINVGVAGMIASIAKVFAAAYKKMMSGGGVVAAARSQIGVPYSWGGGGPGGPSRGIGRGAGTVGFDCSGLTEYAWWRGRRVSIGGVTYSQYPNSTPTGRRPGALGFPHMNHVVLASDKPGYIIEAPYTGARVREVRSSRGYEWRWPKGAGKAKGGPVTEHERRLGRRFVDSSGGPFIVEAKTLEIAGDPGGMGIAGYGAGGWVSGRPGHDRTLVRATAGEYVINRRRAAEHPGLVEAVNAGRVGEAMVRPTIRASAAVAGGGAGAGGGRGAGNLTVVLQMENHGVIGSRIEAENWLAKGLESLRRQGRLPVQPSGRG
ncbi:hypothetical protein [Actinomadura rugatobispora]|uniref:NlpC/P60 domain-containing protein n=1 Tax=Actinomadura rugatobispora TaxID=1994 RepID=A0ABW0ZSI2_9ACTN|nr:hypothetical protein GCM10010200_036510 [Actinomadura rugatobispora]